MKQTDYISPHMLYAAELDGRFDYVFTEIRNKGKGISILEYNPLANVRRVERLIGKVDMIAWLLLIRNSNIGTSNDYLEALVYDFNNPKQFVSIRTDIMKYVKEFNNKYCNENINVGVDEDMKLDKVYRLESTGIGALFIEMCLKEEFDVTVLLDSKLTSSDIKLISNFQSRYKLKVDGLAGPETFKKMINMYPDYWNEIEYLWSIGVR